MPQFAKPTSAPPLKKNVPPAAARPQPRRPSPAQRAAIAQVLQRRAAESAAAEAAPKAPNRTGLPKMLKAGVERLSGLAMDDVRVHRDSAEPAKLGALAYTQGSEIHLGPGQERHLPHEAWHVAQQKQGRVQATTQLKGARVNDDKGLEAEADHMARRIEAASSSAPRIATGKMAAADAPLQKKTAPADMPILQLQEPGKGFSKPVTKEPRMPQDNTRASGIDELVKLKMKDFEAEQAAKMNMTPEQKLLEKYAKLNPEIYAVVAAAMKTAQPQATISQGRKMNPQEQRYSELWRMEYEYRDKYCSEFEKKYLEKHGGFASEYVKNQIYLLKNSTYRILTDPGSPLSIWRWLALLSSIGTLAGRGPPAASPGTVPSSYPTLFNPKLNPNSGLGTPKKLRPEDL